MKKNIIKIFIIALSSLILFSCEDNEFEKEAILVDYEISIKPPIDFENVTLSDINVVFQNIETGIKSIPDTKIENLKAKSKLLLGLHKVKVSAKMTFTNNGVKSVAMLSKDAEIEVSSDKTKNMKEIALTYEKSKGGFVISEIFFTGTKMPEGNATYDEDKYMKITNNSNEVMYADGLSLVQTHFQAIDKHDYTPDIREEAMVVDFVTVIPGDGNKYPIQPGETFIICQSAIDHSKTNKNSFDLSQGKFEWLSYAASFASESPNNPNIPDMIPYFTGSENGVWSMDNTGTYTLAIVKIPVTKDEYLKDYKHSYSWMFVFENYKIETKENHYKIPNSWVLDAVNLSTEDEYQWNPISTTLDAGWTFCSKVKNDEARYGLSVIRKSKTENGRIVYTDTNNSTNDFEPKASASLLPKDK